MPQAACKIAASRTLAARPAVRAASPAIRSQPNIARINAVNIGLMVGCAVGAWLRPFEMLLIAYAVLGPLHYLTEISWLHDRGYFTATRLDALPLVLLGIVGALEHVDVLTWDGSVVVALALAAVFALVADRRRRWVLAAVAVLASLALQGWANGWLLLVVLLPTVIHVFCFTGVFILHGSIKSRSILGYVSLAVFLACGLGLLLYQPAARHYAVSEQTAALGDSLRLPFDQLGMLTGWSAHDEWDTMVAFGRFLAFAYTYHYLNWFSKTGIIRWHEVSGVRLTAIGGIYIASVALYAYDYRAGLTALFALSFIHVLLEFPLDVRTIAALGAPTVRLTSERRASAPA
jgi:hypothetical protein